MSSSSIAERVREFLAGINAAEYWADIEPQIANGPLLRRASSLVAFSHAVADLVRSGRQEGILATEAISDLSAAMLLAILGGYKSSMMMLRSSIENGVRSFMLASTGREYSTFEVAPMFLDAFHHARGIDRGLARSIISLRANYKFLCRYVHTADQEVMSLEARLKHLPRFDQARADGAFARTSEISFLLLSIFFVAFGPTVRAAHADIRDAVLDSVAAEFKALA